MKVKNSKQKVRDVENISLVKHINNITEKEGLSSKEIVELINDSFKQAYCVKENENAEIELKFNDKLLIEQKYKIVEKVVKPDCEILNSNSLLNTGRIEDGFFFKFLNINEFDFNLTQNIRQNIQQKIKVIQQEKRVKNLQEQCGQLIRGKSRPPSFNADFCLVDLEGGNLGFWPKEEWENVSRFFHFNKSLLFLIKEVQIDDNKKKIILTRDSEKLIRKVMELEIPEIKNGIIKIKQVIRIPGLLNKITVGSNNQAIDPVGSCIGQGAIRIKSIRENTFPEEKIELVAWNEKKEQLFFNLLLPAKVISLIKKEEIWETIIPIKHFLTILKNRMLFIKKIEEILQKKIKLIIYEDLSGDQICVWNGNISYNEFLELKNDEFRK